MENETPTTPVSNSINGQTIETSGGAIVINDVNVNEGDFIGRDKIVYGDEVHGDKIIGYTADQVALIISQVRDVDQPQRWDGREPYVGLSSFREQQAHLFFGREKLITYLLRQLATTRLLCITGPSGSGKSSLVQAGLIPAMRANQLAGGDQWLIETLVPGLQPVESLALAVGRMAKLPSAANYLRKHGPTEPATLHAQVETLLTHHSEQRAIIVVDQFEELFTQIKDDALCQPFLNLLTYAAQQAAGRVLVLLVMRSDFVSQCAAYPDLRTLMSGHIELVGAMQPEELTRAIALPALAVGVEIKPDLVAQVINDMAGEPGALPLMEFALKDLFDAQPKAKGQPVVLTRQAYLARGGIQQALERHAEQTFTTLSHDQQVIARTLFMNLIEIGRGTVDTRRTATFNELIPSGVDAVQVESVVQLLAAARLITTADDLELTFTQGSNTEFTKHNSRKVTLAHEALISAWPWLQRLIKENRAAIEFQNQIGADAVIWEASSHDPSYLYVGARLQTVQEQFAAQQITLNKFAQQFVDAGVQEEQQRVQQREATRERELAQAQALAIAERKRAEQQAKANSGLRVLSVLAVLLAVAAGWFGIQSNQNAKEASKQGATAQAVSTVAVQEKSTAEAASTVALRQQATAEAEKKRADTKTQEAQQQARRAKAGEFAADASREVTQRFFDPSLALLLAKQAVTMTHPSDGPVFVSAVMSLDEVLRQTPLWRRTLRGHSDSVVSAVFSPDGQRIVTASMDNTARIWDSTTGQELHTLQGPTNWAVSAVFSPDGKHIVITSRYTVARIWETETGRELHTLQGHTDEVVSAAFSPNSKLIVTASNDNTARIWDVATGQEMYILRGHTSPVNSAVFSSDGKYIVTTSSDTTARLWDAQTGQLLHTLRGHTDYVDSVAFSPDSKLIVTASGDNTVRVWNAATGQALHTLQGHTDNIVSTVFSPDGQRILTASYDTTARIWDATTGQALHTLQGHTDRIMSAVFSPDGQRIVTASYDNTARIWDATTGQELYILQGHTDWVVSAVFSPDGQRILTASNDNTARIWDAATRQKPLTLQGHTKEVGSAFFSPSGQRIVTASNDNTARIWDATTGQELHTLRGHTDHIASAVFSPDGKRIVTASIDHTARIWDVTTGQVLHILQGHTDWVVSAVFSSDGQRIVTASNDTTACIWDAATGQKLHTLQGHRHHVVSAVFSSDGQRILTASDDATTRIWDATTGQELHTFEGYGRRALSAVFSPDGQRIVTTSEDKTAHIWDATTGQELHTLEGHTGGIMSAVFSPDGKRIVTASIDHTARIWDATTGKALHTLEGHTDWVVSAVFSPDGKRIVTASYDNTARVWDAATGQEVLTLQGHAGEVVSAVFSPNGQWILTASADTTARTWFSSISDYMTVAQRLIQRDPPVFTSEERKKYGLD